MIGKFLRLTLYLLLTLASVESYSTHIVGGVIEYVRLGPGSLPNSSRYKIKLRLWRDANGNPWFPNPVLIEVRGDTLGYTAFGHDPVTATGIFPNGLGRMVTGTGTNLAERSRVQFIRDFQISCNGNEQDTITVRNGAMTTNARNNNTRLFPTTGLPSYENPEYLRTNYPTRQFMENGYGFVRGVCGLSANPKPATLDNACTGGRLCVPPIVDSCVTEASRPKVYIQYAEYTRVVELPNIPGGYHLYYRVCCRNNAILNLDNPGSQSSSAYARIPDIAALDNTVYSGPITSLTGLANSLGALYTSLGGNPVRGTVLGITFGTLSPEPTGLPNTFTGTRTIQQAVNNSSPRFNSTPPLFICRYTQIIADLGVVQNPIYDHGATDLDADSVVYELVPPTQGNNNGVGGAGADLNNSPFIGQWTSPFTKIINGITFSTGDPLLATLPNGGPYPQNANVATFNEVRYINPFDEKLPLGVSALTISGVPQTLLGIVLNTASGIMQFNASAVPGLYVVGVRAREYRRVPGGPALFLGEVMRDYQFRLLDCPLPAIPLVGTPPSGATPATGNVLACNVTTVTSMPNNSTAAATEFYWDMGRDFWINTISGPSYTTGVPFNTASYFNTTVPAILSISSVPGVVTLPGLIRRSIGGVTLLDAQSANTRTTKFPNFDFQQPGTYFVKLVVQGRGGKCSDSVMAVANVGFVRAGWFQNPAGPICVNRAITYDPFSTTTTNGITTVSGTSAFTNPATNPLPMRPFVSISGMTTVTGFTHYKWMQPDGTRAEIPPPNAVVEQTRVVRMDWDFGNGLVQYISVTGVNSFVGIGGCTAPGVCYTAIQRPVMFGVTILGSNTAPGNTLGLPRISYAYPQSGTYTGVLKVYSQFGCINSLSRNISIIQAQPTAVITPNNVCVNNPIVTIVGAVTIGSGGIWAGGNGTYLPTGRTMTGQNLNLIYRLSASEQAFGSGSILGFTLTTTGNGVCPAGASTITGLTLTSPPIVYAGTNASVCRNNLQYTLSGSVTGVSSVGRWITRGSGTFLGAGAINSTILGDTYRFSIADSLAGSVRLVLQSLNNGKCNVVSDSITLTVGPVDHVPIPLAGTDQVVCANNSRVNLNGALNNGTIPGAWSTLGDGLFGPSNTTTITTLSGSNAFYTPGSSDISQGFVSLVLSSTLPTANGGCRNVSDTLRANIVPTPTVLGFGVANNGSLVNSLLPCNNNDVMTFVGTVIGAGGMVWSGGTGTYLPSNISPNLSLIGPNMYSVRFTYLPSAAEKSSSSTNYNMIFTSTSNGTCLAVSNFISYRIAPIPVASIIGPNVVCKNNPNFQLVSSIRNVSINNQLVWFSSGSGSFTPSSTLTGDNNLLTYIPSASDTSAGSIRIIMEANRVFSSSSPQFSCRPVYDTLNINFSNPPIITVGPNQLVCTNNLVVTLSGNATLPASGGVWRTTGSGTFVNSGTNTTTVLSPVYIPSLTDVTNSPVTLVFSSAGPNLGFAQGQCQVASRTMQISFSQPPTISFDPIPLVCENAPTINITASVSGQNINASSSAVIGGGLNVSGYVPNNNNFRNPNGNGPLAISASYTPNATELSNKEVTLIVTASGLGNCQSISNSINIPIANKPLVDITTSTVGVCANNPTFVLQSTVVGAASFSWSGGSNPLSISGNRLQYTPSTSEINAGGVKIYLTSNGEFNNCATERDSIFIPISKSPQVSTGGNSSVCTSANQITITGLVTFAGGGIWTTDGSGTFTQSTILGSNMTTVYNISTIDKTSVTPIKLTLTSHLFGACSPVFDVMNLSFTTAPVANAGPDQTVCMNDYPVKLSGSGSPGSWSANRGGLFGSTNGSSSTNLIDTHFPSVTVTGTSTDVITYRWTTNPVGACASIFSESQVTVIPAPVVSFAGPAQICGISPLINLTNFTFRGATGAVLQTAGSGQFTTTGTQFVNINSTTGSVVYRASAADISNGFVVISMTGTGTTPCTPTVYSYLISITSPIVIDAGPNIPVQACDDFSPIQLNGQVLQNGVPITTPGILWSQMSGTSGTFNPGGSTSTSFNPSFVASPTGQGTVRLILSLQTPVGACTISDVKPDTVTYTMVTPPTLNISTTSLQVCSDVNSIQLSATLTGAAGLVWSTTGSNGASGFFADNKSNPVNYVLSASDKSAGLLHFTALTQGAGVCSNSNSNTVVVTVVGKPSIDAGSDMRVCSNLNNITLSGAGVTVSGFAITPMQISWVATSGVNSGTFLGVSSIVSNINGTISGSNNVYSPSLVDKSNGLVSLIVSVTTPGNACPVVTDTRQLEFYNAPTVSIGSPLQQVCSDIPIITLTGALSSTTTVGAIWVVSAPGTGVVTNVGVSGLASYLPTTLDRNLLSLNFILQVTSTGCLMEQRVKTIQMTPVVTVTAINTTICGDTFSVISLTGFSTTSAGRWTTTATGNFFPNFSYFTGTTSSVVFATTQDVKDKSVETNSPIKLTLTSENNGVCSARSADAFVTVLPKPVISAGSDETVCTTSNQITLTGVTLTGFTAGRWTTSGGGVFTSTNTNTGTSILNERYIPNSTDKSGGTVILTFNSSNTGSNLCAAVSATKRITFIQAPSVSVGPDRVVCSNNTTLNINAVPSNYSGFYWRKQTGTGIFLDSLQTSTLYFPSKQDSITSETGVVTISAIALGMGPCAFVEDAFTLKITKAPILTAPENIRVCSDTAGVAVSVSISNLTSVGVSWSNFSNPGTASGSFFPNRFSLNPTYVLSASDKNFTSLKLVVTSTGNGGCNAVADTVVLSIDPIPVFDPIADRIVCSDFDRRVPLVFSGFNFTQGLWTSSGDGDFGSPDVRQSFMGDQVVYNVSNGDISRGKVVFRVQSVDNGLCKSYNTSFTLSITGKPSVALGPDLNFCRDVGTITLSGNVFGTDDYAFSFKSDGLANVATFVGAGFGDSTLYASVIGNQARQLVKLSQTGNSNSYTFYLNVTSSGVCKNIYRDTILVSLQDPFFVTITGPSQICASSNFIDLSVFDLRVPIPGGGGGDPSTTTGFGVVWSAINSSGQVAQTTQYSSNNFSPDIRYFLSPSDKSSNAINYSFTTTGNGLCNARMAYYTVSLSPVPVVSVNGGVLACDNNRTISITGFSTTNAAAWSSTSSMPGTFSGNSVVAGNLGTLTGSFITSIYTVSTSEIINNEANLLFTSSNNGVCDATSTPLKINVKNAPTVSVPPAGEVCSLSGITVTGTITPSLSTVTSTLWSIASGVGTLGTDAVSTLPGNIMNVRNIFTATGGSGVTLSFTATEPGCAPISESVTYRYQTIPGLNAGNGSAICASDVIRLSPSSLSGLGIWTTSGSGFFVSSNSKQTSKMNDEYKPGIGETGLIVFTLIGLDLGCGLPVPAISTVTYTISGGMFVDAGNKLEISICTNFNPDLLGTITGTSTGRWSSSGTGRFISSGTAQGATITGVNSATISGGGGLVSVVTSSGNTLFRDIYEPSEADKAARRVILTLFTVNDGSNICLNEQRDTISINFVDPPSAVASGNKIVCANVAISTLPGLGVSLTGFALMPSPYSTSPTLVPDNAARWKVLTGTGYFMSTNSVTGGLTSLPTSVSGLKNQPLVVPDVYIASINDTTSSAQPVVLALETVNSTTFTGGAVCNPVIDIVEVRFNRAPGAQILTSISGLCGDQDFIELQGDVRLALGNIWSTNGTGFFAPDSLGGGQLGDNTRKYFLSSAEKNTTVASPIIFGLKTAFNGSCLPTIATPLTVTIYPKPGISAGTEQTVCGDLAIISLSGFNTITFAGAVPVAYTWLSSGVGSISGIINISAQTVGSVNMPAQYHITENDRNFGFVQFTLSTTGPNTCSPLTQNLKVNINPRPVVTMGLPLEICNDADQVTLSANVSNVSSMAWSVERFNSGTTVAGTGTFVSTNISSITGITEVVNKSYIISAADQSFDGLLFTATTTGYLPGNASPQCSAIIRSQRVTFTPRPTVSVSTLSGICSKDPFLQLSGTITGALGGRWSSTGQGTFSPSNLPTNPSLAPAAVQYYLAGSDRLVTVIGFSFETTDNGTCKSYVATTQVAITPRPIINPGPAKQFCVDNLNMPLTGADVTIVGAGNFRWITFGSGTITGSGSNPGAYSYVRSAADSALGAVTFGLLVENVNPCSNDTAYVTYTFDPTPSIFVSAGLDQTICADHPVVNLNGVLLNGQNPKWRAFKFASSSPTNLICSPNTRGVFRSSANQAASIDTTSLNPSYFPSSNDICGTEYPTNVQQTLRIALVANGRAACSSQLYADTMSVTFTPRPEISLPTIPNICANDSRPLTLTGLFLNTVAGSGAWETSAEGQIQNIFASNPPTIAGALFFPTSTDKNRGSVSFTFRTTSQGSCNSVSRNQSIQIFPGPALNPGPDLAVCESALSVSVSGVTSNVQAARWYSTGSGNYVSSGLPLGVIQSIVGANVRYNDTYIPSSQDKTAGLVLLWFKTVSQTNNCPADSARVALRFDKLPIVNAGFTQSVCTDFPILTLSGTVTNANGGIWSVSLGGTGVIANPANLNTTYRLSQADKALQRIVLSLQSNSSQSQCPTARSLVTVTIDQPPLIDPGNYSKGVCDYESIELRGTASNTLSIEWNADGAGAFATSKYIERPVYFPRPTDINKGFVLLTMTGVGIGKCQNVSRESIIRLPKEPKPPVNTGSDVRLCENSFYILTINGNVRQYQYQWFARFNNDPLTDVSLAGINVGNIPVSVNGIRMYVLKALNPVNECSNEDDLILEGITVPSLNFQKRICYSDTLLLPVANEAVEVIRNISGGSFQWYFNGQFQQGLTDPFARKAVVPGDYTLEYTYFNCIVKDTTNVRPLPYMLTRGRVVCENTPFDLYVQSINGVIIDGDGIGLNFDWGTNYNVTFNGFVKDGLTPEAYVETFQRPRYRFASGIAIDSAKYVVQVVDPAFNLNCTSYDTVRIKTHPIPDIRLKNVTACENDIVTLQGRPLNVESPKVFTYEPLALRDTIRAVLKWTTVPPDIILPPSDTNSIQRISKDNLGPGLYMVRYSIGECIRVDSAEVRFNAIPIVRNDSIVPYCFDDQKGIVLDAGGKDSTYNYLWLASGNTNRTELVYDTTKYYVKIFNRAGCSVLDSILVRQSCSPRVFVPTGFIPDGENPGDQYFQVFGKYVDNFKITIYSRWGEVIFRSDNFDFLWDGTYNGAKMPMGSYPYILEYDSKYPEHKGRKKQRGSVTLIR